MNKANREKETGHYLALFEKLASLQNEFAASVVHKAAELAIEEPGTPAALVAAFKATDVELRLLQEQVAQAENARAFAEKASQTDPMTGAWNRAGGARRMHETYSLALRNNIDAAETGKKQMLVLFALDIDHFKKVNDTYGHGIGDKAICGMVATAQSMFGRPTDTVIREGGEEFLIAMLCEEKNGQRTASRMAEKLRAGIAAHPAFDDEGLCTITASIGVAFVKPETEGQMDAALAEAKERADAALYRAKHDGRNCVRFAPLNEAIAMRTATKTEKTAKPSPRVA